MDEGELAAAGVGHQHWLSLCVPDSGEGIVPGIKTEGL